MSRDGPLNVRRSTRKNVFIVFFLVDDLKGVKHLNTFQLIQYLIKKEGFGALYKGLVPVMQSSCISNFVYFYVFHL